MDWVYKTKKNKIKNKQTKTPKIPPGKGEEAIDGFSRQVWGMPKDSSQLPPVDI